METLQLPQGEYQLSRYPIQSNETLRAWDAADEYLLKQLSAEQQPKQETNTVIVNDSFGALTTALAEFKPAMISDSYLSQQGTIQNLKNNHLESNSIQLLDSLHYPTKTIDLLIIKIPKSHALLEDQLHQLRPLLNEKSRIIAAAMAKQIHSSTLQLFEKIIGPTHTSLAKKKARLVFCEFDNTLQSIANPYPKSYTLEGTNYTILNHANVFSRERLDIGTRFLLQHLPTNAEKIIDLGCGNGIVGLMAAQCNPSAELTFVDESFMAITTAEANFQAAFSGKRKARFITTDCLTGIEKESADLIINNPPFHQQHAIGDHIAWQMFKQSKEVLIKGGELRVIGNRHLGYQQKLKKLFGNCELVASNAKFVILSSKKR